jgi:hypothetical protein
MPEAGDNTSVGTHDQHLTSLERQLAAIWCRVLKLGAIDVHENFFDLGG